MSRATHDIECPECHFQGKVSDDVITCPECGVSVEGQPIGGEIFENFLRAMAKKAESEASAKSIERES